MPDELYDLIKAVPPEEYISVTRNHGKHGQNWSRQFRTFCEHAKITADDLSAYNLRHEYGTECARSGLDVRVTMRLMGHSSIKMTAEVYTNLEDSDVLSSVSTLRHVRSGVHPGSPSDQDVHPPVHPKSKAVGNA
ncbi:MAG: site-specific integrase [Eubacterium sp.]|nr:site-specific integrase [Eubacterium sp.]MCH4046582.1 site-specific integrase [Eubacterium sp.]MCH4079678.1 site-specific integrase [Eubacterium sp.]MCH4110236.1 site-specific integrase [Eubacterium sp.]MCI1307840.1 site-specific integrase [Eubacterium sp.]